MNVELLCVGLLGLLLFGLGLAVSLERGKAKQLGGIPGDETTRLYRLIRAHGNTSEYVPLIAAFALYFAATESSLLVTSLVVWLTAVRFLHATALITGSDLKSFSLLRFIGGLGTYLGGLALSVLAITSAI